MEKIACGGFVLGDGLTQTTDENGQPVLSINGGGGGLPDPSELNDGTAMIAIGGEWQYVDGYAYTIPKEYNYEWDGDITEKEQWEDYYKISEDVPPIEELVGFTIEKRDANNNLIYSGQIKATDIYKYTDKCCTISIEYDTVIWVALEETEIYEDEPNIDKGVYFQKRYNGEYISLFKKNVDSTTAFDKKYSNAPLIINLVNLLENNYGLLDTNFNDFEKAVVSGRDVFICVGNSNTVIYRLAEFSFNNSNKHARFRYETSYRDNIYDIPYQELYWSANDDNKIQLTTFIPFTINSTVDLIINHTNKTVVPSGHNVWNYPNKLITTGSILRDGISYIRVSDEEAHTTTIASGYMMRQLNMPPKIVVYVDSINDGKLEKKVLATSVWDGNPSNQGSWEYVE